VTTDARLFQTGQGETLVVIHRFHHGSHLTHDAKAQDDQRSRESPHAERIDVENPAR